MTTIPLQPPMLPNAAQSPLTPLHYTQLGAANKQGKKIRRAAAVAATDAWLSAIFAGLTLLCGIVSLSPVGIILGLALALVTFNSFRGLRLLRKFEPPAARLLALNQLLLAAIITAYALSCIYAAARTPDPFASYAAADPQLATMLQPFAHLAWILTLAVYLAVIAATLVAQGLTACYYFTRQKHLLAYHAATPQWIRDLQAATAH